jgi:hypothetical protein
MAKGEKMVEAVGVEPDIRIANTQLSDSQYGRNAQNDMISRSTVQTLYKHLPEFPELQPSGYQSGKKHSEVLFNFYTGVAGMEEY